MRIFLFFVLIGFISSPSLASEVRMERFNIMFEGNESAAAYVRHCFKKGALAARQFQENSIMTAEFLAREMMADHPQLTESQAFGVLEKKQSEMAPPLDSFYQSNGCNTSQARAAKKHFDMFNAKPPEEMRVFLSTIENQ